MGKISAVINVVEEEVKYLPRLLASLKSFVDEIVVIDMTKENILKPLVKKEGIKVVPHEHASYVELVRNFGVSKAAGKWILIIDPDEEVAEPLTRKLREIVENPEADFYRLPRKNIVFDKWLKHSRWWPDYNIRFFKKGYVSWDEIIHGVPVTQGAGVDLPDKEEFALIHYHYVSIEQYLERINRYTDAQAKLLLKGGYKFIWKDLIKKPWGEFLSRYFFGEGYKDSLHGLAVALLQAFSELILYLKVWQSEKFMEQGITVGEIDKEFSTTIKETRWWLVDMLIKSKDELSSFPLKLYRKFFLKNG